MSYAIQNKDGEHLGFLLMAGEGEKGDCIFRSLPNKSELFETPGSEILSQLQEQGEFEWQVTNGKVEIEHPETKERAVIEDGMMKIGDYHFKAISIAAS